MSDLAEELARHVPVRVVAPGPRASCETWSLGVEVFRFAAPEQPLSTLKPWKPAELLTIRRVLDAGEEATRRAVQSGPTGHILALWALPSGHWARRVARASGVAYSVWTLGSDIWTLGHIPLVRTYLRRVLRDAKACYSDGLKLADETRRIGGREVRFLPSTRRIERTRTEPLRSAPPYRLLFLGRWHLNKGVDLLIEALRRLTDDDWQRIETVEICGGGPLEPVVRAGIDAFRAAHRPVELHGYLDKAAAEDAMLRADWLLIPSRIESIPVVFSDAMKMGLPVVAMPVGDLPGLVAGHGTGHIASATSAEAFAHALARALDDAPSRFLQALSGMSARFDLAGAIVPDILRMLQARQQGAHDV
ncbi:MAG: glycosyltransferase family 4 protein [Rhodanobacteraceae bacterium]|nr:glycosyltransferase family 4 protein [Rhodanobacteraceae bacterium]